MVDWHKYKPLCKSSSQMFACEGTSVSPEQFSHVIGSQSIFSKVQMLQMIKTTQTCSCNLANKSFLFQNVPCMRIFVSVYNQSAMLQCLSGTLEKTHKNSRYDQQQLIESNNSEM